jgi:hypothetical protein
MSDRAVYALCFTILFVVAWESWTSRFVHVRNFVFLDRWSGTVVDAYSSITDYSFSEISIEQDRFRKIWKDKILDEKEAYQQKRREEWKARIDSEEKKLNNKNQEYPDDYSDTFPAP